MLNTVCTIFTLTKKIIIKGLEKRKVHKLHYTFKENDKVFF